MITGGKLVEWVMLVPECISLAVVSFVFREPIRRSIGLLLVVLCINPEESTLVAEETPVP